MSWFLKRKSENQDLPHTHETIEILPFQRELVRDHEWHRSVDFRMDPPGQTKIIGDFGGVLPFQRKLMNIPRLPKSLQVIPPWRHNNISVDLNGLVKKPGLRKGRIKENERSKERRRKTRVININSCTAEVPKSKARQVYMLPRRLWLNFNYHISYFKILTNLCCLM